MFDSLFGGMKVQNAIDTLLERAERIVNISAASEKVRKLHPEQFKQFDEMLEVLIKATVVECNKTIKEAERYEKEQAEKEAKKTEAKQ